jgi:NAD(P)-dependent dehydrogenase (short-subunit alcohol dehydrogenase family)
MSTSRPDAPKSVFVSGAGGGLGGAAARYLARRGWRVFAADCDAASLAELAAEPNIEALTLDVTVPASLEAARARVARVCDGLDGIVNFAGILAIGSVIELDPETIRRVLDVNVLGTVRVNHALFPLLLARKGRIVNISSETGWQSAMPFNGSYAMSKHAIEAYSDALRRELMFLGVTVIKIQPGPFRTAMVGSVEGNVARAALGSRYFREMLEGVRHATLKEQQKAHDPELLARTVHTALCARRPCIAYSVKPDPQRAALSRLPERVVDALLRLALRPR